MKQTIGVFYRCSTLPLWLMGITHSRSIEGFLGVYKKQFHYIEHIALHTYVYHDTCTVQFRKFRTIFAINIEL